jgi:hypothetical protein
MSINAVPDEFDLCFELDISADSPESSSCAAGGSSSLSQLAAPYSFPSDESRAPFRAAADASTDEAIIQRLAALKDFVLAASPGPLDYLHTRPEACELGLALNRRKSIAPAFRPFRRAKPPSVRAHERGQDERWFVADRVVLEVDWIRVRNVAADPCLEVTALLAPGELDLKAASTYASQRRRGARRGSDIGLPEHERLLVTCFHDAPSRERSKTIEAAVERFRLTLLDLSAHRRYRLTGPEAIAELKVSYRALLIARGSPDLATRIVPHVGGGAVVAQRMRDIKRRIAKLGAGFGD